MKLAIAAYEKRIAALLESSDRFLIMNMPIFNFNDVKTVFITNNSSIEIARLLTENDVVTLICGAISQRMQNLLELQSIHVVPWITGNIIEVADAFQRNELNSPKFIMPGCRRQRHCRHQARHRGRQRF